MGDKTGIIWTDSTWNPISGCTKISEGCQNCYAEEMSKRFAGKKGWGTKEEPFKVMCHPDRLDIPLKWKKPRRIFVCSMGDLFHEDVPDKFLAEIWSMMAMNEKHTFLILTKRPEKMQKFFEIARNLASQTALWGCHLFEDADNAHDYLLDRLEKPYLPNVHLGVTAENQEQADKRIPILLQIPASKHFVSIEPMLGAIDLRKATHQNIQERQRKHGLSYAQAVRLDLVIVGGESGAKARPLHPDWVRKIRDDCKEAGTPFMFKQWGEWELIKDPSFKGTIDNYYNFTAMRIDGTDSDWYNGEKELSILKRVGKKKAGRLLDGVIHDGEM